MDYKPAVCPIQIEFQIPGVKPLQLDIAIIVPAESTQTKFEHLVADTNQVHLGDEMYFGGYSNEVEFPFAFDRNIDGTVEGMDAFRRQFGLGIRTLMAGPMIKHGIVGNVVLATVSSGGADLLSVSAFYLDNQIHFGASGGPIVCREGRARGIIVSRSLTTADQKDGVRLQVPSGSTWGISLDVLRALQRK
jgi:hypothetical protein